MGLADWLRKRSASASTPDLEAQLAAAREAEAKAKAAVEAAHDAFLEAGDDQAARALAKARTARELAADQVARAEQLMADARARDAAQQRAADEQRRQELRAELTHEKVSARIEPIAQREAELIAELAQLRFSRQRQAVEMDRLAHELRRIERTLDANFASRESGMWIDELGRTRCPAGVNAHASVCTAGGRTIEVIGSSTADASAKAYAVMLARAVFAAPAPSGVE